ncbi:glycosyltransferase [Deefgea piscis]|uniref:Glycosyltransferase n=1 Tax=Deefgea piscis TaxID=2739061 RepID=A0A6M8T135_9NEIS|nr:glycosyltransferase family 2 protein [Deefgea piscis]QKJ67727.1 glycosyltransferase [Deefgea piscis]
MLIEPLQTTLSIASALAAIYTLPGSWALARWSWAARRAAISQSAAESNANIIILIPAHNEAATLPRTLPPILALAEQDGRCTVVVICDNCSDASADIARQLGANALVRHNETARGKGHALAYAFQTLPDRPWYLIVDADSRLDPPFLSVLRQKISSNPAAVQTRYEPDCAAEDPLADLKQWALHAFNVDRQRGRANLGESVSLLGNGFAVSSATLAKVPYQAGSNVEDFEYQLRLQAANLKISWLEDVAVHGEMPYGQSESTQRARWEGGRIAMLRQFFGYFSRQLLRGNRSAWPALQELLLLPLSWHALLLALACLGGVISTGLGLLGVVILLAHVTQALFALPTRQRRGALLGLPRYLLWKLTQLPAILRGRAKNSPWLRSQRQAERSNTL